MASNWKVHTIAFFFIATKSMERNVTYSKVFKNVYIHTLLCIAIAFQKKKKKYDTNSNGSLCDICTKKKLAKKLKMNF